VRSKGSTNANVVQYLRSQNVSLVKQVPGTYASSLAACCVDARH